ALRRLRCPRLEGGVPSSGVPWVRRLGCAEQHVVSERFGPAARGLSGVVRAPADKSISHRAALLAAMGEGTVRIGGYLRGADTLATLDAVRALGADVRDDGDAVVVGGVGLRGAREPGQPINMGNAGTLLRLLPGWLAGQDGRSFT